MNLIISHIADIDGITPIILGKIIFKDLDYKLCEASEINDLLTELINNNELDKYEKIFITDLSVNLDNAKIIEEKFKDKIKIFDHHLPSLKLSNYSFSYSKVEDEFGPACGTSLFLKYLKPLYPELNKKIINDFCELVRISDTWLSDNELFKTARNLEAIHSIYGNDKFIEIYTNRLINNEPIFNDQETFLLTVEEESKNNYIKLKEEELIKAELLNYNVGIVFAEKHRSELGNYLAIKYQDTLDFILLIDISRGISYRGIKDINLAEIANVYGGNGHRHASGSPLPENIKETILNCIFKDIIIKK